MKHLTYTVGAGGNFIACLLCHSKYGKPIPDAPNNEYGCEYNFKHGKISHYVSNNPTILIHEPNKKHLYKKQTILLYKRIKRNRKVFIDTRLSIKSLLYNGDFEFQIGRQKIVQRAVQDFKHIYTWHDLFYDMNIDTWHELFDFFKCNFHDEYLTRLENYSKKNDKIFNSDETARIREFLQKYT